MFKIRKSYTERNKYKSLKRFDEWRGVVWRQGPMEMKKGGRPIPRKFPKMGELIKDKEIWDQDFGELVVDRELIKKFAFRHRGSVRISEGLYYTKEEYETKRKEILSRPLP